MESGRLDPLLEPGPKRFVLFPIKYRAIWRSYKTAISRFWVPDAISTDEDLTGWNAEVPGGIKESLLLCLELLAKGHKAMHDDLTNSLCTQVMSPEARCFFGFQATTENIHAEALSRFKSFFLDNSTGIAVAGDVVDRLLAPKIRWTSMWTTTNTSFSDRLIAMAVVKSVFSSSIYCLMLWIVEGEDLELPSFLKTLRLMLEDIRSHVRFAILLIYHLQSKPSQDRVSEILQQAVDIEQAFTAELLTLVEVDREQTWITASAMREYISFLGKMMLGSLGYEQSSLFENPFPWMFHPEGRAVAFHLAEDMESAYTDASLHMTSQLHNEPQIYHFFDEDSTLDVDD